MAIRIEVRAEVWDRSGGVCAYCKITLHPILNFTVDHVIAVAKGGSDDISNLVAACKVCNLRKNDRDLDVFLGSVSTPPKPRHQPRKPHVVSGWVADPRKVKLARRNAALTLRGLEALSGVRYVTIHRIEHGRVKEAHPSTLRRLADALNVEPVELMSEVRRPKEGQP